MENKTGFNGDDLLLLFNDQNEFEYFHKYEKKKGFLRETAIKLLTEYSTLPSTYEEYQSSLQEQGYSQEHITSRCYINDKLGVGIIQLGINQSGKLPNNNMGDIYYVVYIINSTFYDYEKLSANPLNSISGFEIRETFQDFYKLVNTGDVEEIKFGY